MQPPPPISWRIRRRTPCGTSAGAGCLCGAGVGVPGDSVAGVIALTRGCLLLFFCGSPCRCPSIRAKGGAVTALGLQCVRENKFCRLPVDRELCIEPRQGRLRIARPFVAGRKWNIGPSPGGTTEVLTHTLQPRGLPFIRALGCGSCGGSMPLPSLVACSSRPASQLFTFYFLLFTFVCSPPARVRGSLTAPAVPTPRA